MRRLTSCIALLLAAGTWPLVARANATCSDGGDRNGDCRVDLADFREFSTCFSGPAASADPRCACYDFDGDADVDLGDYRAMQAAFTGDQLLAGYALTPDAQEPALLGSPPAAAGLDAIEPREILKSYFETGAAPAGVYEFSGEFHASAEDLRIPGRGLDFVWARKYRAQSGPDTAMGAGWDFSYNVFLTADGNDLVLHDGNTRADRYARIALPGGDVWCASDFFRVITQNPDGSYVCTFPRRDVWRFQPLDGSPAAGRLSAIADASTNALSFAYDAGGRLTTVTDTLNRPITVGYDADGRVSSVTDFSGRAVTYVYYTNADSNGAAGDLKSVTTPAVTNTPNGNDFPNGKTTVYTYATGASDPRLNHNLLTVTDPKGQTYLTNVYDATTNALDPGFDRITRQQLGAPGDFIDYVYESVTPAASNGYAVTRCIVNDRNGHVSERLYDKLNRCVSLREYTGTADPDKATSSSVNRPANKLRASDPDFYETRFAYNGDSLLARVVDPDGSVAEYTYAGDEDFLAPARSKANVRRCRKLPGPRGGDQQEIVETYSYDPATNGDTNQVTTYVDGRNHAMTFAYDSVGLVTLVGHRVSGVQESFEYDSSGQLTAHVHPDNGAGHLRRDEFHYYTSPPQRGYLYQSVLDAGGEDLTTTYEYDVVGNVTRVVDPRGNDRLYVVNELDQPVRVLSPVVGSPGARNATDIFYDANDNVVRVDQENRDETGALDANPYTTARYDYDVLDRLTRVTAESDASHDVVTEYAYDPVGNLTLERSGEAVSGHQPASVVTRRYDERDLLFRETRAPGDPNQSTTQYDYDGSSNVAAVTQGLEASGNSTPRVDTYAYDRYNRLTIHGSDFGNKQRYSYDPNGNCI
ncbi:MAG TPA: DUF6531 domain-containing protein, partial [Phycisphaerae bacterium]|nr:DUF6531 domain-containing protein [Phycisphaerae bacterium]